MRLILTFLAILISSPSWAETRVALLIGNSEYTHATPLDNPRNDIDLVATTLTGLDFAVEQHYDLARGDISGVLDAFLRRTRDADITLFYFAGHGMQFKGENYILGTDAKLQSAFDIEAEAMNLQQVTDQLELNSRATLLFIDACRDNPIAADFYRRNFSENAARMNQGLAPVNAAFQGTMLTFSASPGEVAYDGTGSTSPFATAMAEHLPTENIEILSVVKRVIRDVRQETRNLQTPIVTNDLAKEIYLKRGEGAEAAAIAYREEEAMFEAASAINTPRVWNILLNRYPDGAFRTAALQARDTALAIEIATIRGSESSRGEVLGALSTARQLETSPDAIARVETSEAMTRATIRAAQDALKARGFAAGPSDGVLGSGTRRAVADFQLAAGLPSTGALTAGTAAALGVEAPVPEPDTETFVSSTNARKFDPLQLALFETDPRLLRAVEALRAYELVYGFFEGRLYLGVLTWRLSELQEAVALAQSANGYLATLTSRAENAFVYDLVREDRRFWKRHSDGRATAFGPSFGLYQLDGSREPDGGWVWVTGEPYGFTNWLPGSPVNVGNLGRYASFIWDRWPQNVPGPVQTAPTWHDMDYIQRSIVIEIE